MIHLLHGNNEFEKRAALAALVLLSVLGVVAGLAPALRAMNIKPVDAMRDE